MTMEGGVSESGGMEEHAEGPLFGAVYDRLRDVCGENTLEELARNLPASVAEGGNEMDSAERLLRRALAVSAGAYDASHPTGTVGRVMEVFVTHLRGPEEAHEEASKQDVMEAYFSSPENVCLLTERGLREACALTRPNTQEDGGGVLDEAELVASLYACAMRHVYSPVEGVSEALEGAAGEVRALMRSREGREAGEAAARALEEAAAAVREVYAEGEHGCGYVAMRGLYHASAEVALDVLRCAYVRNACDGMVRGSITRGRGDEASAALREAAEALWRGGGRHGGCSHEVRGLGVCVLRGWGSGYAGWRAGAVGVSEGDGSDGSDVGDVGEHAAFVRQVVAMFGDAVEGREGRLGALRRRVVTAAMRVGVSVALGDALLFGQRGHAVKEVRTEEEEDAAAVVGGGRGGSDGKERVAVGAHEYGVGDAVECSGGGAIVGRVVGALAKAMECVRVGVCEGGGWGGRREGAWCACGGLGPCGRGEGEGRREGGAAGGHEVEGATPPPPPAVCDGVKVEGMGGQGGDGKGAGVDGATSGGAPSASVRAVRGVSVCEHRRHPPPQGAEASMEWLRLMDARFVYGLAAHAVRAVTDHGAAMCRGSDVASVPHGMGVGEGGREALLPLAAVRAMPAMTYVALARLGLSLLTAGASGEWGGVEGMVGGVRQGVGVEVARVSPETPPAVAATRVKGPWGCVAGAGRVAVAQAVVTKRRREVSTDEEAKEVGTAWGGGGKRRGVVRHVSPRPRRGVVGGRRVVVEQGRQVEEAASESVTSSDAASSGCSTGASTGASSVWQLEMPPLPTGSVVRPMVEGATAPSPGWVSTARGDARRVAAGDVMLVQSGVLATGRSRWAKGSTGDATLMSCEQEVRNWREQRGGAVEGVFAGVRPVPGNVWVPVHVKCVVAAGECTRIRLMACDSEGRGPEAAESASVPWCVVAVGARAVACGLPHAQPYVIVSASDLAVWPCHDYAGDMGGDTRAYPDWRRRLPVGGGGRAGSGAWRVGHFAVVVGGTSVFDVRAGVRGVAAEDEVGKVGLVVGLCGRGSNLQLLLWGRGLRDVRM